MTVSRPRSSSFDFGPVSAPRSNSFNFGPTLDIAREPGALCPLPGRPERIEKVAAGAPERALMLRLRDRMRVFRTTTRDFGDDEVARAKRLGQLYLDVSRKAFVDDFSKDLRLLEPSDECRGCHEAARCPASYIAKKDDVFAPDETRVRCILRQMEGSVLDVGAGHAPYAAELEPKVRAGSCRYLALDPDAERLRLLRGRHPWAETRQGVLEDLAGEPRRFRHVLLLRSYNHLSDRARLATKLLDLLEPGGTLLLVDDVAFGLVRDQEQIRRAESGPALFEHFSNDTAEEAHAMFSLEPLTLLERRDVAPGGSNQWLLWYRKEA